MIISIDSPLKEGVDFEELIIGTNGDTVLKVYETENTVKLFNQEYFKPDPNYKSLEGILEKLIRKHPQNYTEKEHPERSFYCLDSKAYSRLYDIAYSKYKDLLI